MNENIEHRFRYSQSLVSLIALIFAVVIITITCGYIAIYLPESTIQKLLVDATSEDQIRILFGLFAVVGLIGIFASVGIVIKSQNSKTYLELHQDFVLLPEASTSMKLLTIPYNTITSIRSLNIMGNKLLIISSSIGESRLLSKSFESSDAFRQFTSIITRKSDKVQS